MSRQPARHGRALLVALALLLATPALVVAAAALHFRHVPFRVPEAWRPPPPAPGAGVGPGLWLRYLGVSGYAISDGTTRILIDPTPTRPTVTALLTRALEPDLGLHAEVPPADFILVNHSHYDHALDVPALALRDGATVVGTRSTVNLARSRGVPEERTIEARPGQRLRLGSFVVDVRSSRHSSILGVENPMSGTIPADAGALRFWEMTQDGVLVYRLESEGTSLWVHPTTMYRPGDLGGLAAATLVVGVNGEAWDRAKLGALVAEARPQRVLPTHYDNFLQPLERGLALMPGVDLAGVGERLGEVDPALAWIVLDYGEAIWLAPDPGPEPARPPRPAR